MILTLVPSLKKRNIILFTHLTKNLFLVDLACAKSLASNIAVCGNVNYAGLGVKEEINTISWHLHSLEADLDILERN